MILLDLLSIVIYKVVSVYRYLYSYFTITPPYKELSSTCLYLDYHQLTESIPSPSSNSSYLNAGEIIKRINLPEKAQNSLRFVIISDTHGRQEEVGEIPHCDVFIHCGDILLTSRMYSKAYNLKLLQKFNDWLRNINAKNKLIIAGNHDRLLEKMSYEECKQIFSNGNYLQNSYINCENLSIFATPFSHGKSRNFGFQSEEFLENTLQNAPPRCDILISHGNSIKLSSKINHNFHFYGHNHNIYGIFLNNKNEKVNSNKNLSDSIMNNVSVCAVVLNEFYQNSNPIIVIDLPNKSTLSTEILETIPTLSSKVAKTY